MPANKKTPAKTKSTRAKTATKTKTKKTISKVKTKAAPIKSKEKTIIKKSNKKTLFYAGFWKRVAVMLCEKFIENLIIFGPMLAYYQVLLSGGPQTTQIRVIQIINIGVIVLGAAYLIINIYLYFRYGRTVGDYLLKTKLIDAKTGKKPKTEKLIGRFFAKILSGIPFGLGFWWAGWSNQKQAWHDTLSGTRYVETKSYNGSWTWFATTIGLAASLVLYVMVISQGATLQNKLRQAQFDPAQFEILSEELFEEALEGSHDHYDGDNHDNHDHE